MSVEAASSRLTEPEELLAATIAGSSTWQMLAGAANATEALDSIYFDSIDTGNDDDEDAWTTYQSLLPFALITTAGNGFRVSSIGINSYTQSGTLGISFECEIPNTQTTDEERGRWFKNRIGDVITEMLERNSEAGYLTIDSVDMVDYGFGEPEQESARGFVLGQAAFVLTYGGGGQ